MIIYGVVVDRMFLTMMMMMISALTGRHCCAPFYFSAAAAAAAQENARPLAATRLAAITNHLTWDPF